MKNRQWALTFIMPFGKYKGEKLGALWAEKESYVRWLWNEVDANAFPELVEALRILIGDD